MPLINLCEAGVTYRYAKSVNKREVLCHQSKMLRFTSDVRACEVIRFILIKIKFILFLPYGIGLLTLNM